MDQLRRRFASLWKREEGEGDAGAGQQPNAVVGNNGQNPSRRSSSSSTSSAGVPAALEIDAAGAAPPGREKSQGQRRHDQQRIFRERKEEEEDPEDEPSPPRLLSLSHPWGTSDPRPPPGWESSSSLKRRHIRANQYRLRRRGGEKAADGHLQSPADRGALADLGVPAGAAGSLQQQQSPPEAVAGRRRRGREDEEEEDEEACAYRRSTSFRGNAAATKRPRASQEQADGARLLDGGGEPEPDEEGDLDQQRRRRRLRQQQQQQQAPIRRRTCPADSTFVSPAAKRSVGYCASTVGATAVALAADQDEEELEHRRSSTPSRLIFRAGFFKALRGGRAAAKRARSATKLKRKTRELQAAIVRRAFHSAHPPHEDGREDAGGGEGEEQKEEGVPRHGAGGVRGVYECGRDDFSRY